MGPDSGGSSYLFFILVLKRKVIVALSIPRIALAEQSRNNLIRLGSDFIV
jgi:hypothetical protein